jgi:hypothetical protein
MREYLDRKSSIQAINNIKTLFADLDVVYEKHGIDIGRDIGRKNILISAAQEHFFAKAIDGIVGGATNDGRTGMADIVIGSLGDREVECKVLCQGKTGSWSLQTDKASLLRKGSCDFLYLLFDRTHDNVALLLFADLTADDFHDPSSGSRGKARLRKSAAFPKCKTLIGDIKNLRLEWIEKYTLKIKNATTLAQKQKAEQKLDMWYNKVDSYNIQLECINDLA